MINQFMIEYFEESMTDKSYINAINNIQAALLLSIMTESSNNYYIEASQNLKEASQNLKEAIKEFFAKLIQAIKDLVRKIKDYIHEKIQNIQMNKKLNELKKAMSENRSKLNGAKVKIFDTTKYMIAYRKYIDLVNVEFKKLTSKKYENSDAFQKEAQRVNELIDSAAERLGLTSDEKYAIETDVFNALSITEKSIKLYDNEFNLSAKEWEESIRTNGKTAEMEENPTIADRIKVLSHKFSNVCSKCFQFMSKHPIASVVMLSSAVYLIIRASKTAGISHGNTKYFYSNDRKELEKNLEKAANRENNATEILNEIQSSKKRLTNAWARNNHEIGSDLFRRNNIREKQLKSNIFDADIGGIDPNIDTKIQKMYDQITKNMKWDAPLPEDGYDYVNRYSSDYAMRYQ